MMMEWWIILLVDEYLLQGNDWSISCKDFEEEDNANGLLQCQLLVEEFNQQTINKKLLFNIAN